MACEVEYTDEFETWWNDLTLDEQRSVAHGVGLLETQGIALGYPHSSHVHGSKHGQMRELRIQHQGRPYRVFYAFDPRRAAILLIGGVKSDEKRFYELYVPIADSLYDGHLAGLERERRRP
jgi:hypothetical protein